MRNRPQKKTVVSSNLEYSLDVLGAKLEHAQLAVARHILGANLFLLLPLALLGRRRRTGSEAGGRVTETVHALAAAAAYATRTRRDGGVGGQNAPRQQRRLEQRLTQQVAR